MVKLSSKKYPFCKEKKLYSIDSWSVNCPKMKLSFLPFIIATKVVIVIGGFGIRGIFSGSNFHE
jgi:hypothetical protein